MNSNADIGTYRYFIVYQPPLCYRLYILKYKLLLKKVEYFFCIASKYAQSITKYTVVQCILYTVHWASLVVTSWRSESSNISLDILEKSIFQISQPLY